MANQQQRRKGPAADKRRIPKKKQSILDAEKVEWIDYKDVNLLRRFMSERAKIRARRVNGNDAQQQAAVARAIKVAREMALLPYSVRQVTQRSKGKGRDRGERGDRGDRGERDLAAPDTEVRDDTENDEFTDLEVTEADGAELELAAVGGDEEVEG